MNLTEKTLAQTYRYKGKILNLRVDDVELPDGRPAIREVIEHHGGVCVLPLTDDDQVLLVRQFRYPYGQVLVELPAGTIDPGEQPLACGMRELKEETGATAARYEFLGEMYPSAGYSAEVIHLYLATGLDFGRTDPDDDEFLEVERRPFAALLQDVLTNRIPDAKTQVAVLKLACRRGLR